MKLLIFILLFGFFTRAFSQTIPSDRVVDWTLAGVRDSSTSNFVLIDMLAEGLNNNGAVPCDAALSAVFVAHPEPAVFYFPAGTYLFNAPINLRSNCILRGAGATATHIVMDHSGSGNGINSSGTGNLADSSSFAMQGLKNDQNLHVLNSSPFAVGDWIRIVQDDADLVTSTWAIGSVGQIVRISEINGNTFILDSPLRMNYPLERHPRVHKISPKSNIGIECLSIDRLDNTAPEQASVISFNYTVNSWVNGIEINKTTFAHVEATACSNLAIVNSYFHDAHEYGGGGRGYGVMLHFTTNECLVYSNVFNHLRHSMILQAGANGNVFCYNYSRDPYWTGSIFLPSNSAGDMVLHGNYPYSNLFEQNDGQNMVIDNSHGANGPHNTYFRNRGSLYGIFFSDNTSPNQNLVGNEITNTSSQMSAVNYSIQGTGHFLFGNNNKGTISPTGSNDLPDSSYCFVAKPTLIPLSHYASIGEPNALNSGSIPATYYYQQGDLFANACGYASDLSVDAALEFEASVYPNPVLSGSDIQVEGDIKTIQLVNAVGDILKEWSDVGVSKKLTMDVAPGLYSLRIISLSNTLECKKLIVL